MVMFMRKIILTLTVFSLVVGLLLTGFFFVGPLITKIDDVTIPEIVGEDIEEGLKNIEALGLNHEIEYVNSNDKVDTILDIYPKVSSVVKKGSTVVIYVSQNCYYMPNLIGRYVSDAKDELIDYDIVFIDVVDNELPIGYISDQKPMAGSLINYDSSIILFSVIHDDDVILPNMVGWSLEKVKKFENENQLYFEYQYDFSYIFDLNTVVSQSCNPGTKIKRNNRNYITITISRGVEIIPDFTGIDIEVALAMCDYLGIKSKIMYVESNEKSDIIINCVVPAGIAKEIILYVSS